MSTAAQRLIDADSRLITAQKERISQLETEVRQLREALRLIAHHALPKTAMPAVPPGMEV